MKGAIEEARHILMTRQLTCPNGHLWESDVKRPEGAVATACPVCGVLSTDETTVHASKPTDTSAHVEDDAGDAINDGPLATVDSAPKDESPQDANRPLPAIDGYELLAELGRGGMGIVYRARHLKLKRDVALKMILTGPYADSEALARFRTEAEAVARLQHANIVQIYEVGEADGRPYLSLEFVDGGSLSDKLKSGPLPTREAAEAIRTLASAIAYAHGRKVLHRDLKPANVLLTSDGTLKITDFGLAKQLDGEASHTATGDMMGTPRYMAPEQASGVTRHPTTACDVYSLGVMLYEMLTGRPPLVGHDAVDTLLRVLADEPVPPRRLEPRVPRDLETICLKCLQKPPHRRYASASELVEDLDRYLNGEPIAARPVGSVERARKWARRRPASALAAALAFFAPILIGLGLLAHSIRLSTELANTARERSRAQADLALAQDTLDGILRQVAADSETRPEDDPVRRELLDLSLSFCQGLLEQNPTDAEVRWLTARAHRQAAGIQQELGRMDEAERHFAASLDVLKRLLENEPQNAAYRHDLAKACNNRGNLYQETGQREKAEQDYRRAEQIYARLVDGEPKNVDLRREWNVARNNLGILMMATGRNEQSIVLHRQAIEDRTALVEQSRDERHTDSTELQVDLATSYTNLGAVLRLDGQLEEAQAAFRRALSLISELPEPEADRTKYQLAAASNQNNLAATLAALGETESAEAAYANSEQTLATLSADYATVDAYRRQHLSVLNNQAALFASQGRGEEAAKAYERAILENEGRRARSELAMADQRILAQSLEGLGRVRLDAEEYDESESLLERSLELRKQLADQFPENGDLQSELGLSQFAAGELLLRRGDERIARHYLQQAVAIQKAAVENDPQNAAYRGRLSEHLKLLAETLLSLGEPGQAAAAAEELAAMLPDDSAVIGHAGELMAQCFTLAQTVKSADFDADECANRAVQLLREALRRGTIDVELLENSPALAPLRERAEFKALLAEMEDKNS